MFYKEIAKFRGFRKITEVIQVGPKKRSVFGKSVTPLHADVE